MAMNITIHEPKQNVEFEDLRVMSIARAADLIGISLATIWRLVKNDRSFPQLIRIGARRRGILATDLRVWIESRRTERAA